MCELHGCHKHTNYSCVQLLSFFIVQLQSVWALKNTVSAHPRAIHLSPWKTEKSAVLYAHRGSECYWGTLFKFISRHFAVVCYILHRLSPKDTFYSRGLNSVLGPSRLLMVLVWCHLSHHDAHKQQKNCISNISGLKATSAQELLYWCAGFFVFSSFKTCF